MWKRERVTPRRPTERNLQPHKSKSLDSPRWSSSSLKSEVNNSLIIVNFFTKFIIFGKFLNCFRKFDWKSGTRHYFLEFGAKSGKKFIKNSQKIRFFSDWINEYSLIHSQTLRILRLLAQIFDEFFSGFRAKFQKRVTPFAFSIKFAKTN